MELFTLTGQEAAGYYGTPGQYAHDEGLALALSDRVADTDQERTERTFADLSPFERENLLIWCDRNMIRTANYCHTQDSHSLKGKAERWLKAYAGLPYLSHQQFKAAMELLGIESRKASGALIYKAKIRPDYAGLI